VRTLQTTGLQLFSDPVSFGRKKMAADKAAFHDLSFRLEDYSLLSIKPNNLLLFLATAVTLFFSKIFIFMVRGIVYDMSIIEHLQLPKSERLVLDNEIQQFPSTLTYKRISKSICLKNRNII